jgi:hypothetical protein
MSGLLRDHVAHAGIARRIRANIREPRLRKAYGAEGPRPTKFEDEDDDENEDDSRGSHEPTQNRRIDGYLDRAGLAGRFQSGSVAFQLGQIGLAQSCC